MESETQQLLTGVGLVVYGIVGTLVPRIPAMFGRLGYALLTPGEGLAPERPEIWLARVLGMASLAFGAFTLYGVLA